MSNTRPEKKSARGLACAVLDRVLFKAEFAAAALDDELARATLADPRDRALATELAYGVLRTKAVLTARLDELAHRSVERDTFVFLRLLVAAYELWFLDRVPDFASVNEAVNAVRAVRGPKVAGFCNAVLRRLATAERPSLGDAIAGSVPSWLRAEVEQSVGAMESTHLFGVPAGGAEERPRAVSGGTIRLRDGAPVPGWASEAPRGQLYPGALYFSGAGDLRRHPEYARGHFVIQDEGSMFGALALGTRPGEKVLDACAGRGHKASLLAEHVGNDGTLWVTDTSKHKLEQLRAEFQRLDLPEATALRVDWTQGDERVPRDFDRVLVDAPCTGTGTLRRRPEIALRLTPQDVERLATQSESILRNAARHVRPEGHILFVVCSVLARETIGVVQRVSDVLESVRFDCVHPALSHETTSIHLLPGTHGCDGFFLASLRPKQAC